MIQFIVFVFVFVLPNTVKKDKLEILSIDLLFFILINFY